MQEQKMTAFVFDATKVAPEKPMEVMPNGWQNFEISDAFVSPTKGAKPGKQITFELFVIDGEYKGRKVWHRINAENASAKAEEIGQQQLSAVCHAVGILSVADLAPFVGRRLQGRVVTKAETDKYDASNEIKGVKPLEGGNIAPAFAPSPFVPGATPPPIAQAFPPAGWVGHPTSPGWFWNQATNEILAESDLRAKFPAPVAFVAPAPPVPVAPPVVVPPAAPEAFPPAGWLPHPTSPGYFYQGQEVKTESELRAMFPAAPPVPVAPSAPAVPAAPPAPPAAPAAPVTPAPGGATPPWLNPGA